MENKCKKSLYIMKNSLNHRLRCLSLNTVSRYNSNVKKDVLVKELNFASTSAVSTEKHD